MSGLRGRGLYHRGLREEVECRNNNRSGGQGSDGAWGRQVSVKVLNECGERGITVIGMQGGS